MKTFYNSTQGVILVSMLFTIAMLDWALSCPCDKESYCVRHEFYGVQYNHLYLFVFLGFCFPSYFITWQILGALFELLEYWLDNNNEFVIKHLGGCLMKKPFNSPKNPKYNFIVYKNQQKYLNPIDRFFKINNSKIHSWHGSVAEILPNIIGFAIGYYLNKSLLTS
tara:strand:- start:13709 stop:14206 length:498 start_codon:yes stop_codon:yes gene_type:complete